MASSFKVLRSKDDTGTADPAWHSLTRPIGPRIVVAGVDTDGDHSFDINPVDGETITVTYPRVSGDGDDDVADGLAAAANTLIATTLATYLEAAVSDGIDTVYLTPRPAAPAFTVDNAAVQGGASLTFTPDDTFPITARMPESSDNGIMVTFCPLDSSGNALADNTSTADVALIISDPPDGTYAGHPFVSRTDVRSGHSLVQPITAPMPAGVTFTVSFTGAVSSPPASLDRYRVYWTPITLPS